MQKSLTWVLTILALALFAFIFLFERKAPSSAEKNAAPKLFARLEPRDVNTIEVTLASGGVVRAEQTNGTWFLTKPLYPAQQSLIETFVTNIARLRRYDRIPAHEVALQGQKSFGFEPARATVLVETATNRLRFEIGGPAPLTNNLYVRVEPSAEVVLAQADLLQSLPQTTNDWRSEKLIPIGQIPFDHLQVRAGPRIFELGKNPTNNLWQITKPIPARGDQDQIASLFERLGRAEVGRFVADGAVDLERYNLQAPQVELAFEQGTNRLFTVEFGGTVTNENNAVYARLLGTTNIVTVASDLPEFLRRPYKAFHDPRLLTLNANALDRILVHSLEKFPLQRQPNGQWNIGDKDSVPADPELLAEFLRTILSMRILDIAKEVPAEADLQALGLSDPRVSYSFFEKHTNTAGVATNILFSQISFGSNLVDRIYVRRSDETPVYITELAPLVELPHQAFRLRARHIWNFSTNDIVRISLSSPAGTNSAMRSNSGWSADPVVNAAIEEAAFRLSQLKVERWAGRGEDAVKAAGIAPQSQTLEVEIKTPAGNEVRRIAFGKQALRHNIYATIPAAGGEPVVFEFSAEIYHLLNQNLPAAK
jgi:hypothetical protein